MPSIAIIGCGLIGETHAKCLAELGTPARIFCDQNIERAEKLAAIYGGRASYVPHEAIEDKSIDAVYICTYHDTHAPLAVRAAEQKKHIFLEKPMATNEADTLRIVEAVRQHRVHCMTGFKLHYYSLTAKAVDLIGIPKLLVAQVSDRRWPDTSWANDPIAGGGNVLSQGCHAVELLSYLAGSRASRVYAEGGNLHHPGLGIVDGLVATITYESGAVASLTVGDLGETPRNGKFSVQAMNGTQSVHLYDRLTSLTYYDGTASHIFSSQAEDGFLNENKEFLAALAEDRRPETSEIDGMRTSLTLLSAIESARTRTPQSLEHLW